MQSVCAAAAGGSHRLQNGGQALGRGKGAGKHQIEPSAEPFPQRGILHRDGVEILAVLWDDRHFVCGFSGSGAQPLLQRLAHGDQAVGFFVKPVADALSDAAQQFVPDRQHAVQIFRPQVQHIVGEGDMVLSCVENGRPAHQHRAGVKAEHRIITAGQTIQRTSRIQRPADVIQKNIEGGVALAGQFFCTKNLCLAISFLPRAVLAVSVKPFPFGVVGQTAQHVHLIAILREPLHHIVDAEILRPKMLRNNEDPFCHQDFLQTILLTTPV